MMMYINKIYCYLKIKVKHNMTRARVHINFIYRQKKHCIFFLTDVITLNVLYL